MDNYTIKLSELEQQLRQAYEDGGWEAEVVINGEHYSINYEE